jgi:hypothetical protein
MNLWLVVGSCCLLFTTVVIWRLVLCFSGLTLSLVLGVYLFTNEDTNVANKYGRCFPIVLMSFVAVYHS